MSLLRASIWLGLSDNFVLCIHFWHSRWVSCAFCESLEIFFLSIGISCALAKRDFVQEFSFMSCFFLIWDGSSEGSMAWLMLMSTLSARLIWTCGQLACFGDVSVVNLRLSAEVCWRFWACTIVLCLVRTTTTHLLGALERAIRHSVAASTHLHVILRHWVVLWKYRWFGHA